MKVRLMSVKVSMKVRLMSVKVSIWK